MKKRIFSEAGCCYDQKSWQEVVDRSNNRKDACHDYIELDKPLKTKYIKIENVRVPDGKFSIYDLRIFGRRKGKTPAEVKEFTVERDASDTRRATLKWLRKYNCNRLYCELWNRN